MRKSSELRVVLKRLCINKICKKKMLSRSTGHVKALPQKARGVSLEASSMAWKKPGLDNESFLSQHFKKHCDFYFAVSLPVSTWQKPETALPRMKAWTWATFLLSTHPLCFSFSRRLAAYLIMINRCLDNQIQHQKVGDDSPRTLGRKQGTPGIH